MHYYLEKHSKQFIEFSYIYGTMLLRKVQLVPYFIIICLADIV